MTGRCTEYGQRCCVWLLLILLTVLAVMRGGLHAVPGMGHAVRVGNRAILLGVCAPVQSRESGSPVCSLVFPEADLARMLDPAACPLCRLLGIPFLAAVSDTPAPAELQARLLAAAAARTESPTPDFYQARGPPEA